MSQNLHRKLRRAGVQRAEHNARRMFQVALSKMQALEVTFIETLNELPFWRRASMAVRLVFARMRPIATVDKKEAKTEKKEVSRG
jgi:hypothetical protein